MNWTWLLLVLAIAVWIFFRQAGGLASAEAVAALRKQEARVFDVRTMEEFREGHLPEAINLPLADLSREISQIAPDKNQPLLLHCASGMRSGAGKKTLEQLGYTNVHNLGSYARAAALLNPAP